MKRAAAKIRWDAAALAVALILPGPAGAVEYIPVYNATLLGGQYFFQGARASLSGNATAVAAPVFRTSERWSFIPMYAASYQGVKGTGDGVGAGTLFQQQMDHRASFTAIMSPEGSPWKYKPAVSYKRQFLKETRDESWGHGLFDFEKIAGGFELENVYREPFSYRLGVDFYRIRFPNYESLESKSGVDPSGNPLGRELSSRHVLDTYNAQATASASRPYPYDDPKVSLEGRYSILYQNYHDQRLVNAQGQFTDSKPFYRQDFLQTVSASVGYPRPARLFGSDCRMDSRFGVHAAHNGSNQNTFDASRTKFIFDSYSYYSWGLGPSASVAWGDPKRPASVGASFRFTRTQYTGRLAQDPDGLYVSEFQYQDRYVGSLTYAYPIAKGFYLRAQGNFLWAVSNNRFEKTYSYNYRTANYLMGFTYEY